MRYLITTLAEYQTKFWVKIGLRLEAAGHTVAFMSFDDRSTDMLKNAGLRVFEWTSVCASLSDDQCAEIFAKFGIKNLNYWISHERFAFGLTSGQVLKKKLASTLVYADGACRSYLKDSEDRIVMVQELGGFLSVVGSFFAARHNGIEHWFIEPSFFRGRLFLLRNRFSAIEIKESNAEIPCQEMLLYLERAIKNGEIVIPLKDKHQYTNPMNKVVNWANIRRFIEKLKDKFILNKHYEFGYISHHVKSHFKLILNSFRLKHLYTDLTLVKNFVYYPLHVPGDMALTLRTPHLLDQLSLIDYLCRSVPDTYFVAIKEHPAMVGAVDPIRIKGLLSRYDNLRILDPSSNNYKVISEAQAVVSINSKSGAEAALLGKPVLVLGDAFYKNSPLVTYLNSIENLPKELERLLSNSSRASSDLIIKNYFSAVWGASVIGELYVDDEENLDSFSRTLSSI